MTVLVVTDTTASLDPDLAAQWGVKLVPLTVTVAGRAYRDTEIDIAELAGQRATTAGPPPGEFVAALRDASDGAVIVTVASALSSTFSAALVAASMSDVRVEVVDSMSAAGAQALVVLAAVDRAHRSGDVADVADAARVAAREVRLVGRLETLDGLARSGRVPGIAALAARAVGLQFMFTLRDGSIKPIRPAGSSAAALDRIVETCVSSGRAGAVADLVLLGDAAGLEERLSRAVASGRLVIGRQIVGTFGTAITLYTGPAVSGLAWRYRSAPPRAV